MRKPALRLAQERKIVPVTQVPPKTPPAFRNVRPEDTPNGPRFHPLVRLGGSKITLRACETPEEAAKMAEEAKQKVLSGETTLDDLRNWRKITIEEESMTARDWAKRLKVTENTLYKGAKAHNLSLHDEILRRLREKLPPTQR